MLEREVEGPGVLGLAHLDCYTLWREESAALRQPPTQKVGHDWVAPAW
jgi:hypothetical protein